MPPREGTYGLLAGFRAMDQHFRSAPLAQNLIYLRNQDVPGVIGKIGTILGKHDINIANFSLGRNRPGGDAIALLYLDAPFPEPVLEKVRAHKSIDSAKRLQFDLEGA